MVTADEIRSEIGNILRTSWATRDGRIVPGPDDVQLGNDAIKLDATVLYADLAGSTAMVDSHKDWFAAEVYKCFLRAACLLVQSNQGVVTAFDGDRIMGVCVGDSKNSNATRTALQLHHVVTHVIDPMVKERYTDVKMQILHAVGIDTSPLFVTRTGVRGSNDLVWVGRAANYAAKLATIRKDRFATWITKDVFNRIQDSVKFSKGVKTSPSMWEKHTWNYRQLDIYGSTWWIPP
jgi:class 3 adenylate cyclase